MSETFYDGHEKIMLNLQSSNKKSTVMLYAIYLIGISKEEKLDDKILQKILKEGLPCSADGEFSADDTVEKIFKT